MIRPNIMQNTIAFLLVAVAAVPIFSPETGFLRKTVDFSVQLMLVYLALGFVFLILGQKRLLLTSFACCGALCLFLKQSSNTHLILPAAKPEDKLTIAHFNTSVATDGYASLLSTVLHTDADIISFQEVTPDWNVFLQNNLSSTYPFMVANVRIDPYGMAIYSKIPINSYDTFHFQEIPHQIVNIPVAKHKNVNIVSAYLLPPFGLKLNERVGNHLNTIADRILLNEDPSIVLGDFNLVYWSNEIRNFRVKANLQNSRRDISQNLLKIPYDHIFYSDELECTGFADLTDAASNHLGIVGTYQLKYDHYEKEIRPVFLYND